MSTAGFGSPHEHAALGDEAFMSAEDLRSYMLKMSLAEAMAEVKAMDQAGQAQNELIRAMSTPMDLTTEAIEGIKKRLFLRLREAAKRGESEILVMRFPNALCNDRGRAINNAEEGWPTTLSGRPRQAYEIWREKLRPAGYKLKAMIIEWPHGLPGDVGFFLSWSGPVQH